MVYILYHVSEDVFGENQTNRSVISFVKSSKATKLSYVHLEGRVWNNYGIDSNILLDIKGDAIKCFHYVKNISYMWMDML